MDQDRGGYRHISDLLDRMGLEEDFDDLIFEEEIDAPKEGLKWMALMRVHKGNHFAPASLFAHMRVAWSPVQAVKFQELEPNLFTVQAACLGDWNKITKRGPWFLREFTVVIEEYDGISPWSQ